MERIAISLGKNAGQHLGSRELRREREEVETDEQCDLLRREGCTQAQGYLFSKPRPAAEVEEMLSKPRQRIVA